MNFVFLLFMVGSRPTNCINMSISTLVESFVSNVYVSNNEISIKFLKSHVLLSIIERLAKILKKFVLSLLFCTWKSRSLCVVKLDDSLVYRMLVSLPARSCACVCVLYVYSYRKRIFLRCVQPNRKKSRSHHVPKTRDWSRKSFV